MFKQQKNRYSRVQVPFKNRYASFGTRISNLAPIPSSPVSAIVISVMPQNIPGEKEPHPRIFPYATLKNFFLSVLRHSGTIILPDQEESVRYQGVMDMDFRYMLSMAQGIVIQVIKHFFEQGVCINLEPVEVCPDADLGPREP